MGIHSRGFTMVETLIVVVLLGIVAMIIVPKFTDASDEAREATLDSDLSIVRRAIELYKLEHGGLTPYVDENGVAAPDDFAARMTGRTDPDGTINPNGVRGPYLTEWPANGFAPADVATDITCGADPPPRDDSSGWYFCTATGKMHVNTAVGAVEIDPVVE